MNITEKKKEIINRLQQTSDEQLINEVYALIHPDETIENFNLNELPQDLQNKLSKALDDYYSGHYISHDQMQQKIQQWLMK